MLMPGDEIVDAVAFLVACRARGVVFRDAGGALAYGPQHLIDADLAAAIRSRQVAILAALRQEAAPPAPPLSWPKERQPPRVRLRVAPEGPKEWAALVQWLATADLPTEPYYLPGGGGVGITDATSRPPPGVLVADPALSHGYLKAAVAADPGPTGQVRRALLARLRLLRRLAAAGWKLEG